jgi:hypothetical protein
MSDNLVSKALIEFLNTASTHWAANACPDCASSVEYRNCTFFFEGADLGNPTSPLRQVPLRFTRRPSV